MAFVLAGATFAAVATALADAALPARAGHGLTPQCGIGSGGPDRCYAQIQHFESDFVVIGVSAILAGTGKPCVREECNTPTAGPGTPTPPGGVHGEESPVTGCGTFSDQAMWIVPGVNATGGSSPVPEMGVVRFSSAAGGTKRHIYTACANCTGRVANFNLVSPARNGQQLMIVFNPSLNRWEWYLRQPGGSLELVDLLDDAGLSAGDRVDVGGETTHWSFDMGVTHFDRVQVLVASSPTNLALASWKKFGYNMSAQRKGLYPPGDYGKGRFFVKLEKISSGSRVMTWSDHHRSIDRPSGGANDCGQNPPP